VEYGRRSPLIMKSTFETLKGALASDCKPYVGRILAGFGSSAVTRGKLSEVLVEPVRHLREVLSSLLKRA
jgi:hypothetical protein